MKTERVDNYWSNFFGFERDELRGTGIIVVPHNYLEVYNGAWIFKRKNQLILSVPQGIVNQIKDKVKKIKLESNNVFSESNLEYLFEKNIEKIIGPTYQGYYDDPDAELQISKEVDKINFEKHYKLIESLSKSGDEEGWANSGINKRNDGLFGYFYENKIESIACYNIIRGDVGFVGVYTNPNFRGMGFSYEVLKKAVRELSTKDKLIRYQTLISNKPSIRIANKIGFKEYANNMAIRLKKKKDRSQ